MSAPTASERIVSLLASGTEIVCGLGLVDRLVGISHECDFPPQITDLPRVTSTRIDPLASSREIDEQVRSQLAAGEPLYDIDVERLAALAPGLIVTQSQCDVCAVRHADVIEAVQTRPELAATRVVDLNPLTWSDVRRDIGRIARAAGAESAGADYLAALDARVAAVRTATQQATMRPRVACLEWLEPLMLAGNWMPELVAWAGGASIGGTAGEHTRFHAWEELIEARPEVVVVMPCGFDLRRSLAETQPLSERRGWSDLPAVRAGRVWAVDANAYFNRSGPRLVESLELLAWLVQPELAPPPAALREGEAFERV